MNFIMPNTLVIGGAGFIGSHLVELLVDNAWKVTVLDNLSTGKIENLENVIKDIIFYKGDIRDLEVLGKLMKDVEYVFHLAAIPSVVKSFQNPKEAHEVNLSSIIDIINLAKKNNVKRIIFASSSAVYGDTSGQTAIESISPCPISPYGIQKLCAEKYLDVLGRYYQIETVSLRFFNVYGPRQDPLSEYSAVIPRFISRVLQNKPPIIYGDGKQTRDFVYVKDVANACYLAAITNFAGCNCLECNTQISNIVMNVAFGKSFNLIELASIINNLCQTNLQPVFEAERVGDIKHSHADIKLAKKLIGYTPKYTIEEGLKETIRWYASKNKG